MDDVIFPSLLINFCRLFDLGNNIRLRVYYLSALLAYAIALFISLLIVTLTDCDHLASIVIYPILIIATCTTGLVRGELRTLWKGTLPSFHQRQTKNTEDSARKIWICFEREEWRLNVRIAGVYFFLWSRKQQQQQNKNAPSDFIVEHCYQIRRRPGHLDWPVRDWQQRLGFGCWSNHRRFSSLHLSGHWQGLPMDLDESSDRQLSFHLKSEARVYTVHSILLEWTSSNGIISGATSLASNIAMRTLGVICLRRLLSSVQLNWSD